MKNRKRLYALLSLMLVVILALALTGCGKTTDTPNSNQSQQENTAIGDTTNNPEESESQQETTAPKAEVNPAQNSDGKYIYVIDGHDWVIGIKIEDLIHDGQIDASELHIALGFDRTGDLRDANNTVIAKSLAFVAGAKIGSGYNGPYDTIVVFGNANHRAYRIFYNFMGDGSEDAITVVTNIRNYRVTLDQLVVAIYGCEQYRDGEIHEDVYGNLLDDYVRSRGYYLIP